MIRTLKFIAAMFIGLNIMAELGWITILQPDLQHLHHLLFEGVKLILYVFLP